MVLIYHAFFLHFFCIYSFYFYICSTNKNIMNKKQLQPTEQQQILSTASLSSVAFMIRRKLERDTKLNIPFSAKPYLEAMSTLDTIDDSYGCDSGRSIVVYFLSNAQTMRGEFMRDVKAELNKRLKK